MAEIRDITAAEKPSNDHDHVLIARTPGGKYSANGSASGRIDATFWTPPPFDNLTQAIASARDWADANDVPVIYVRDGSAA